MKLFVNCWSLKSAICIYTYLYYVFKDVITHLDLAQPVNVCVTIDRSLGCWVFNLSGLVFGTDFGRLN